jgi:hypothetical protein
MDKRQLLLALQHHRSRSRRSSSFRRKGLATNRASVASHSASARSVARQRSLCGGDPIAVQHRQARTLRALRAADDRAASCRQRRRPAAPTAGELERPSATHAPARLVLREQIDLPTPPLETWRRLAACRPPLLCSARTARRHSSSRTTPPRKHTGHLRRPTAALDPFELDDPSRDVEDGVVDLEAEEGDEEQLPAKLGGRGDVHARVHRWAVAGGCANSFVARRKSSSPGEPLTGCNGFRLVQLGPNDSTQLASVTSKPATSLARSGAG